METTLVLMNVTHKVIEVIPTEYDYEVGDCIYPITLRHKYPGQNENLHEVRMVTNTPVEEVKRQIEKRAETYGGLNTLGWKISD